MENIPNDVQQYRNEWSKIVPQWYSAKLHYFGTSAVSLPLVAYGFYHLWLNRNSNPLSLYEWIMIPFFLAIASLVEYITHRYILHRRIWPLTHAYTEHTLRHHSYYTEAAIEATKQREYYQVFFPVWGVALIQYGVNLPISILLGTLYTENSGYIALIFGPLFFFVYETIHAICHFPANSKAFKIPGLWFLREHHRIHHNKSLMGKWNFNIVFPLWDWILKTTFRAPFL